MTKRTLVIGDIHGCATALNILLKEVQPGPSDRIITLGDYVDRGLRSYEVLEILIHLYAQGLLVPLYGNHEILLLLNCVKQDTENRRGGIREHHGQLFTNAQTTNLEFMMMKIRMAHLTDRWQHYGSEATVRSYCRENYKGLAILPERHFHFFEHNCLHWYETDDCIFVHGGVSPCDPIEETDIQLLHWKRTHPMTEQRHCSDKMVVCGHAVQKNGVPVSGENALCIDTAACCGGWLTCLDIYSGECWQANEQGQRRKFKYKPVVHI